jgi:hypothetical protein
VCLSDGSTLPANLVVVGVGARPASHLFKGQLQLDQQGGVVVDSSLQTSVPGVYAIGDVASFPLVCEGNTIARQEHVTHARTSAAHVVAALSGEDSRRCWQQKACCAWVELCRTALGITHEYCTGQFCEIVGSIAGFTVEHEVGSTAYRSREENQGIQSGN